MLCVLACSGDHTNIVMVGKTVKPGTHYLHVTSAVGMRETINVMWDRFNV